MQENEYRKGQNITVRIVKNLYHFKQQNSIKSHIWYKVTVISFSLTLAFTASGMAIV
jgi:hypothetical protein